MQQRVICVTDQKLYVLKKEALKSATKIEDLMGLTKSDTASEEVGIHMR